MIYTGKIFKIHNSLAIIIPREIIKELKLIKGETLVIKAYRGKLQAARLRDYVKKKERIEDND